MSMGTTKAAFFGLMVAGAIFFSIGGGISYGPAAGCLLFGVLLTVYGLVAYGLVVDADDGDPDDGGTSEDKEDAS